MTARECRPPEIERRCRVALLPDCHVQPGRHSTRPTQPTRRLYGAARGLFESTLERLQSMDVDAIFLLGDTLDPADASGMRWLRSHIDASAVPVHTIIGNHEVYGRITAAEFHRVLDLPDEGNYLVDVRGVPFVMLATPDQDAFAPGSMERLWLEQTLSSLRDCPNVFVCAHFSIVLHPCVQGSKNDGMQVLWAADSLLELLRRHPNVRGWIAGHKNVPSRVTRDRVMHSLSPQLIQAPCAFRVLDVHEHGIASRVYAIEDEELAGFSRLAYGAAYMDRQGRSEDNDFWWEWDVR